MFDAETKRSPEDEMREYLKDVGTIAKKLSTVCEKTVDLVGMLELAMSNDGQLRMIQTVLKGK